MNKFVKISVLVLCLVLLIGGIFYAKNFVIGSKNYDNITIDKVTLKSDGVVIRGEISNSSYAFKDFDYTLVDTELYVSIKSVMVSSKYKSGSFEITIPVNSQNIKNIHLTDDKTTKVIYSK